MLHGGSFAAAVSTELLVWGKAASLALSITGWLEPSDQEFSDCGGLCLPPKGMDGSVMAY